ncbi:hypothetical protein ACOWMM_03615 [Helicobacter pylori]
MISVELIESLIKRALENAIQDLKHFKNDITLILSKEKLAAYDSLEQYKENLKLIASITPKISNLEIYLRNALDHCLTILLTQEPFFITKISLFSTI